MACVPRSTGLGNGTENSGGNSGDSHGGSGEAAAAAAAAAATSVLNDGPNDEEGPQGDIQEVHLSGSQGSVAGNQQSKVGSWYNL